MAREFTILVADRNRRVRQFLMRELVAEGYAVLLADGKDDLLQIVRRDDTLDLLILDDELLVPEESRIVDLLRNRVPHLPFIVHSFSTDCVEQGLAQEATALVEKKGNIGGLKDAVDRVLHSEYPCRFESCHGDAGMGTSH